MTNSREVKLYSVSIKTPCRVFSMIVQGDAGGTVIASGFGAAKNVLTRAFLNEVKGVKLISRSEHPYAQLVEAYFKGDPTALSRIPIGAAGSTFQRKVWRALSGISLGDTWSYKRVAAKVGSPRAMRAVGTVCASNPIVLLVPCHRVIRSDGQFGAYVYGEKIKKWLLGHEAKMRAQ